MIEYEKTVLEEFDSYISKVLRNEVRSYYRAKKQKDRTECSISDLSQTLLCNLSKTDEYFVDEIHRIVVLEKFEAEIKDVLLYEALSQLNNNSKDIVILKFWHDLTDEKIGKLLNMKRSSVNYAKIKALKTLKNLLQELSEDD